MKRRRLTETRRARDAGTGADELRVRERCRRRGVRAVRGDWRLRVFDARERGGGAGGGGTQRRAAKTAASEHRRRGEVAKVRTAEPRVRLRGNDDRVGVHATGVSGEFDREERARGRGREFDDDDFA